MPTSIPLTVPGLIAAIRPPQSMMVALGYDQFVHPGPGDWELRETPSGTELVWHAGPEIASEADLLALWQGPAWLAHRKRALKASLVPMLTGPVSDAWATIPVELRLHNPQLLSVANQSRHAADMTAMASALSAAQQAIDAAQTVADAEAAAAAVTIPTPAGPEE